MLLAFYALALSSAAMVLGGPSPTEQSPRAPPSKRNLRMDFEVLHGNSFGDASVDKRPGIAKRSNSLPSVHITNNVTFYQAVLYVGSNKDECKVLVNSYEPDTWVMASDFECGESLKPAPGEDEYSKTAIVSYETDAVSMDPDLYDTDLYSASDSESLGIDEVAATVLPWPDNGMDYASVCTQQGSFNTAASDTFKANGTEEPFQVQYTNGKIVQGFWGSDTVGFSEASVELDFGVAKWGTSEQGVLGLGYPDDRNSCSNFPEQLKNEGYIDKVAYSLYLNSNGSQSGSVLFGAVDHAKYSGQLQTVPVLEDARSIFGLNMPIVLNGIYLETNGSTMSNSTISNSTISNSTMSNSTISKVSLSDGSMLALLDTGSALQNWPPWVLQVLADSMNGKYMDADAVYQVDCSKKSTTGNLVYDFSGINIKVPLAEMVFEIDGKCYLGVSDLRRTDGGSVAILGTDFLRHAYAVFDLEDMEISLAQARYSEDSDVQAVESTVPSAIKAPGYSETRLHQSSSAETSGAETSGAQTSGSETSGAETSSAESVSTSADISGPKSNSTSLADEAARSVGWAALAVGVAGSVLLI